MNSSRKDKSKRCKKTSDRTITVIAGLLLVIVIGLFMFSSMDGDSSGTLSKVVTRAVITILGLQVNDWEFSLIHILIRKLAHFGIFFIVGSFVDLMAGRVTESKSIKRFRGYIYGLGFGLALACLDEFHQLFVSGRGASLQDVVVDMIGLITGMCFISVVRLIKRRFNRRS